MILMNRASDDIVDFHFSISHNTFKYNTYLFAFPSVRNIKTMTIDAVFIAKIMFPVGIILLFLSRVPYKYNSARRYSLQNLAVPSKTEHLSCSTFESSYLKSTRNSTSQYDPVLYRKDTSLLFC